MDKDHQATRKQLWCDVYVAYVNAANATNPDGAKNWADVALRRFDERFKDETPAPTPTPNGTAL